MDIRNSPDGLRALLGVGAAVQPATHAKSGTVATTAGALDTDRATVSSAGSEMAQAVLGGGVRTEKVLAVQEALATGTYSVPASAVAARLVDAMLAGGQ